MNQEKVKSIRNHQEKKKQSFIYIGNGRHNNVYHFENFLIKDFDSTAYIEIDETTRN